MKERLDYIDRLRGFAILLVVLGHIYMVYTQEGGNHPIVQMIYSFHMPLFFFISGFLCEITHKIGENGCCRFIKKKAIALLVPYLFWLIPGGIIFCGEHISSISDLLELFDFYPNLHYWFMPMLFIMMLLYVIQHCVLRRQDNVCKRILFMVVVCGLTAFLGVVFHLYHVICYSIFIFSFFFGTLFSYSSEIISFIKAEKVFGWGSLLLCLIWLIYPVQANGNTLLSMYNLVGMFVCSVCAIIVFFNFFYRVQMNKCLRCFFSEMGKYSLVIYLTPICLPSGGFVFDDYTRTTENILILLLGIIQCLVSYSIGRFVYEIPYLRLIMYGKK